MTERAASVSVMCAWLLSTTDMVSGKYWCMHTMMVQTCERQLCMRYHILELYYRQSGRESDASRVYDRATYEISVITPLPLKSQHAISVQSRLLPLYGRTLSHSTLLFRGKPEAYEWYRDREYMFPLILSGLVLWITIIQRTWFNKKPK